MARRIENENGGDNLKNIVDGTILLAVKSIVEKAKTGKKLTASDLRVLKELRTAFEQEEASEKTDWDREWRKYKALLAKIDYEVQRGKLIVVEDAVTAWINRYVHIKRHLLLWPKRLCGLLAHQPENKVMEILEEEIRHLLSVLARPGKFCPDPNAESGGKDA